jgi:hypothetical protein
MHNVPTCLARPVTILTVFEVEKKAFVQHACGFNDVIADEHGGE